MRPTGVLGCALLAVVVAGCSGEAASCKPCGPSVVVDVIGPAVSAALTAVSGPAADQTLQQPLRVCVEGAGCAVLLVRQEERPVSTDPSDPFSELDCRTRPEQSFSCDVGHGYDVQLNVYGSSSSTLDRARVWVSWGEPSATGRMEFRDGGGGECSCNYTKATVTLAG